MDELVSVKNDEAVCSSLDVAEKFGKRHKHVMRAIEQIKEDSSAQKWAQSFHETTYKDASGKSNKMYLMNRDGFSILVMGFNGKKSMEWKWKYLEAFNTMAGITDRDFATLTQLNELSFIENIILNQIRVGMEREMHYKDINKDCKRQIELFKDVAYLNAV